MKENTEKRGRKPGPLGKMINSVYNLKGTTLYVNDNYERHKKQFERLFNRYLDYCTENNVSNAKARYNPFMAYAFTTYLLLDHGDDIDSSQPSPQAFSQFLNKCLHIEQKSKKTKKPSQYYKCPIPVSDMVFFLRLIQDNAPVNKILRDVFNFELTDEHKTRIAKILKELEANPEMPSDELKKIFNTLLDLLSESLD